MWEVALQLKPSLGFVFSLKNDELGPREESPKSCQLQVDSGSERRQTGSSCCDRSV